MAENNLGSVAVNSTVRFKFTTHAASGAPVAPSSAFENADLDVYKDGSATPRSSANGITMTSPFNSTTGLHHVDMDLSDDTDAGFYATGSTYEVVLTPDETVDSLAVVKVVARFTIGATLDTIKAETAAILVDTGTTLDDLVDDLESRLGTPSDLGSGATIAANLADIEAQTDDIGAAGAGLTAINLPDQTMDITGNITGNLSGSVGSVTGTIGGLAAAALADFFDTDSGTTYAGAVAGSVVAEIADNAGGASLTVQDIVDGVLDELLSAHQGAGSVGKGISDAGGSGDSDPFVDVIP